MGRCATEGEPLKRSPQDLTASGLVFAVRYMSTAVHQSLLTSDLSLLTGHIVPGSRLFLIRLGQTRHIANAVRSRDTRKSGFPPDVNRPVDLLTPGFWLLLELL